MLVSVEIRSSDRRFAVEMTADRLVIGRSALCDVVLHDDPEVSRVHAVVERLGTAWVIRDLGSRNGTAVNGVRLVGFRRVDDGDEIQIGRAVLHVRAGATEDVERTDGQQPPPPLTPRERDVLLALVESVADTGRTTEPATVAQIASVLGIAVTTVKLHLASLYAKFQIEPDGRSRRLRLANAAVTRGAIRPADLRRRAR